MLRSNRPKGVHCVRRVTKAGTKFHFYAWRGGPKFWEDSARFPNDPAFFVAFAEATARPKPAHYMTVQMVDDFLSSAEMPKGERTRQDYRLWALRFSTAFKDDPAAMFEEPEARGEVNEWRKQWAHSPRQYDYAGTVVTRILNWAWKDAGKIRMHYCGDFRKVYEVDRSEIVWTPAQREAVCAHAPEWVQRILTAGCETGLRPADLVRLHRNQIEKTPQGRRIRIRTNKRKRTATIPVTPAMAALIDATPADRMLILASDRGRAMTGRHASDSLRYWRNKAGLTPEALGYDLRLQDTRGTAATRLLNVGLELAHIASHMGWSVRYAAAVIEHYARVSPDESDGILVKLAQSKGGAK